MFTFLVSSVTVETSLQNKQKWFRKYEWCEFIITTLQNNSFFIKNIKTSNLIRRIILHTNNNTITTPIALIFYTSLIQLIIGTRNHNFQKIFLTLFSVLLLLHIWIPWSFCYWQDLLLLTRLTMLALISWNVPTFKVQTFKVKLDFFNWTHDFFSMKSRFWLHL